MVVSEGLRGMSAAIEESAPPLFDIGATLGVLWARKLVALGVTLAVLLAALAYLAVTTPIYTATATILIDPRDSHATNFDNVLPGIGADSAAISSQVSVIGSTDLLEAVFNSEDLAQDPEFAGRGLVSRLLGRGAPSRDAIFASFRKRVTVEREGLTYVIDISFESVDPEKAARIVNAIVGRYRATLSGEKENANSRANDLLTGKVGNLQKAVSDAERAVQDFKFQHHIFDASAGGTLQSQIDQFSTQLVAAQEQADQADVRYRQATAAGTGPEGMARLSKILSSNAADKLRDDYNQRAAALANSRVVLGPKHPTIARLSAELAGIRDLMSAEAARITEQLKAQRDIAAQNVGQIQGKLDGLRRRANESDLAQVQLRQLQRQADAARSVLDDFLKRSQETLHMEGMQISQVRVVSPAIPPIQATWPKPKLVLLASTVLGLMLGCAASLMGASGSSPVRRSTPPSVRRFFDNRLFRPIIPSARGSKPVDFGSFKVPAAWYQPPQGSLLNIRGETPPHDDVGFMLSVERLLEQIIGRLKDHAKPYVLRVSAPRNSPERRLAAAMVGIGLRNVQQRVLVIDVSSNHRPTGGNMDDPLARALPFTDPASGLQTIAIGPAVLAEASGSHMDGILRRLMMRSGSAADFLVIVDCPLDEPNYVSALGAHADLSLYALGPADRKSGAASQLADFLSAADLDRSATLVIEMEPGPGSSATIGRAKRKPTIETETASPPFGAEIHARTAN
jgi:uncharacterized protein involved in exopolysaccharide biosynthesis